jgi:hypothetical protein
MVEILSKKEVSNLIGGCRHLVAKKLGPPCAIVLNGQFELQCWRYVRIAAHLAGETMEAPEHTPVFYSATEAVRRLEVCSLQQIRPLLGESDGLLMLGSGKPTPIWSHKSLNALFTLVSEARLSGSKAYDRTRPFKHRTSRKARERVARIDARMARIRNPKRRIIRFCSPRHVWADPKAVEACRVR